jgi:hypothetical protein
MLTPIRCQEIIDEARLNLEAEFVKKTAAAATATATAKTQTDMVAQLKKELKLQRQTIAAYEDRLTKVMDHEVSMHCCTNPH